MRNLRSLPPAVVCLLLGVAGCAPIALPEQPVALSGSTMGTTYSIRLAQLPEGRSASRLQAEIDRRLEAVNDQMSTWRPGSELSRFNRHEGDGWFPVSADTAAVVTEALRIHQLTGGVFDVTVGPLVDLWDFGPDDRAGRPPAEDEIAAARERVGASMLEVRLDPPALRKHRPDLSVDLSGIAKGFGTDVVAEYLDAAGVPGYMVEIGGEIRTRGRRQDGAPWRIGIEAPVENVRRLQRIVRLTDHALATSGDYRNVREFDGRRVSHTIDPRTGRPAERGPASVTVVAETAMFADAMATALMVLGPEEAYNLALREGLAALLIVREDGRFAERATPAFEELHEDSGEEAGTPMYTTFLITLAFFAVAVALMAVGVIFSNRRIRGSCGGLANLRDERGRVMCDACSTPSEDCAGPPEEGAPREQRADKQT